MGGEKGAGSRLWDMAHLGTPMAIRVAATLRVADHIAAGVRTVSELAEVVKADPDALGRLLRYLTVRGVFSRDESGHYSLTERGEGLREDHPDGMRAHLDIENIVGLAELSFVYLLHSIRTGEAAYPIMFGRPFWEDLSVNAARGAQFNTFMGSDIPDRAIEIVTGYDWASVGHLVDVGGGAGRFMIELLSKYPTLRGTVVDLPGPSATAAQNLRDAGLADRGDVVPGSFFDPLPPGFGGYVLSLVLHDWNDRSARAILRRCANAAAPEGKVFVIENLGLGGENPQTGMDLRMLAYYGGKERGLAELTQLAGESGLRVAGVHPAGKLSIIELVVEG
jgi:hypothetical protein